MRWRRADPHTLAGAYALDAVGEDDRAAFERHLEACEACRQEADSLREAGARLAAATARTPPPELREKVLAAVARAHQAASPAGEEADESGTGPLRRVAPRLAVAVAGACMLIALIMGGAMLDTQHRLHQDEAHSRTIAAVLNAPDVTIMTRRAHTSGTATLVMSHQERALVLTTAHLPALPGSERYEVWLMAPGKRARPAGMLPPPHRGMTAPMVVSGLTAGERVGLTVEPSAGASRPTTAPVLMVNLPS